MPQDESILLEKMNADIAGVMAFDPEQCVLPRCITDGIIFEIMRHVKCLQEYLNVLGTVQNDSAADILIRTNNLENATKCTSDIAAIIQSLEGFRLIISYEQASERI